MNTEHVECESCGKETIRIIRSGGRTRLCDTCKRERQLARCRRYKANNKERVSQYNAEYKKENKEYISGYNKKYDKEHRNEIQAKRNVYRRNKLKTDPSFKMAASLRSRLGNFVKRKDRTESTEELLGCTYEDFVLWIEFQSGDKFTMENYGKVWHLDHCIPCSKFDLTDMNEVEKCFHWSNIQPMSGSENCAKNNKTTIEEQQNQLNKIEKFVEEYNDQISHSMISLEYDRFEYV